MTEVNKNTLRQAEATINVEGILAEKKLEVHNDANGKECIRGTLTVKIDETNQIVLNVYVGKYTKDGSENRAYAGMETVMREYQSIAEVGEENATKIRCNKGQLQPNTYIDRTGDVKTSVRYSASFVKRVEKRDKNPYEPKAKFEVEGYIAGVVPEMKNGEETGRSITKLWVPTYSGIEPMDLIIPENLVDTFDSTYELGQTANFIGDLKNNVIVKEQVVQMAFGGEDVKKSYDYVDERVVVKGGYPYEDNLAYDPEAIKVALANRQAELEEKKKKAAEDRQKANKTTATANQSSTGRTLPKDLFSSVHTNAGNTSGLPF